MLLLLGGIFGVGFVMTQYMQLNFIVENAAKVEVNTPGTGVAWARTQLASPSFTAASSSCGGPGVQAAQATGTWR
jgi:hypothetical protein